MKPYTAPVVSPLGTISDLTRDKGNGPADGFGAAMPGGHDPSMPPLDVCQVNPNLPICR